MKVKQPPQQPLMGQKEKLENGWLVGAEGKQSQIHTFILFLWLAFN